METVVKPKGWTAGLLKEILNGQWINEDIAEVNSLNLTDLAINEAGCENDNTLFIAIDEDRWHEGSGNRGIYAGWTDTHKLVKKFQHKVNAVIVEKEIPSVKLPQLKVENSYNTILQLGKYARDKMSGKIIAITGTSGKSSTRIMIAHLLSHHGSVIQTKGNHNTRTGVPLTLARCITDPDYCVIEIAISALWMRSGGICKLARPHIGIVTQVGLGQVGGVNDELSTAKMKARICQGIVPGGIAILNRDMNNYEIVKEEVEKHGAKPLTYGFNENADIYVTKWEPTKWGSMVTINVKGEVVTYELPVPGEGMISNSLAAVATLYALGLNVKESVKNFKTLKLKESVLEYIEKEIPGGKIGILDDTYNATIISMRAALKIFKDQFTGGNNRKIGILGRIVNLGEHAERIHRDLAKDILDVGFDKVFLHGTEMKYVLEELPSELVGGYFQDSREMAQAVARYLKDGDYVLMKGSRRGSDFGKIRENLLYAVDHPEEMSKIDVGNNQLTNDYAITVYDIAQGKIVYQHGDIDSEKYSKNQGLGPILLLGCILDELASGNVKLENKVKVSKNAVIQSNNSLGLVAGQEVTIYELLNAVLIKNAPDAVIALAEGLYGSRNKAHNKIREKAKELGLDTRIAENLSGRKMKSKNQYYTPNELIRVSLFLFDRVPYFRKLIAVDGYPFNSLYETIPTNLYTNRVIECGYFFGENKNATVLYNFEGKNYIISVLQAENGFHRDYLIREGIYQVKSANNSAPQIVEIQERIELHGEKESILINLIGDTYFGEFYTERRLRRGREDALTKYGYDYSFQGIQHLLDQGDFNIANFEATLTELEVSPLKGIKPFTLKGNPEKSIEALKKAKIHAVSLGNNHTMDYGVDGLVSTINSFKNAGIHYFGAGLSSHEAEKPLRLKAKDRTLVFISAYWYRQYMHEKFDFYAMPGSAGVACLNGGIKEVIRHEKKINDNPYIIILAHWGIDYGRIQSEQREMAEKLISYGADLIIGHGAHMLQDIDIINNKYVVYSIGNGVFNSDGEYDLRDVPPFSYFVKMFVKSDVIKLELYPLMSNNRKTFWQTRLLTEEELAKFNTVFKCNVAVFDGEKITIAVG